MHKGKPLLMAVFNTATRAEGEMIKILQRGDCCEEEVTKNYLV
jgi:hypothetical protein